MGKKLVWRWGSKGIFTLTKRLVVFLRGPFRNLSCLISISMTQTSWQSEFSANLQITMLLSKRTYTGLQEPYKINQEQIGDLAPGKDIPLDAIQAGDWLQGGKICWKVSGSHSRQQADQKLSVCPASRGPKASWAGLIGIQPVDWGTLLLLKTC